MARVRPARALETPALLQLTAQEYRRRLYTNRVEKTPSLWSYTTPHRRVGHIHTAHTWSDCDEIIIHPVWGQHTIEYTDGERFTLQGSTVVNTREPHTHTATKENIFIWQPI